MEKDNILEVKDLHVDIKMAEGLLTAVRGVNFEMKKGETLGLVGESGCGKSLTCKAILGINDVCAEGTYMQRRRSLAVIRLRWDITRATLSKRP